MAEPAMPGEPDRTDPPPDQPEPAGPESVPGEEDREPSDEPEERAHADDARTAADEKAAREDVEEVQAAPARIERFGRPLRRSAQDQIIAGVCGGLGRYIGVDPALIRIAFVLLAFAGGSGILLYLIAAAVIPKESPADAAGPAEGSRVRTLRRIVGWGLVVAGGVLLIGRFVPDVEQVVWPVVLLAIGAAVLAHNARR